MNRWEGALGIKQIDEVNKALSTKWLLKLMVNSEASLVKVLKEKFQSKQETLGRGSNMGVSKGADHFFLAGNAHYSVGSLVNLVCSFGNSRNESSALGAQVQGTEEGGAQPNKMNFPKLYSMAGVFLTKNTPPHSHKNSLL